MELERTCPHHDKPLKRFEGISKKTGQPYGNWKCTAKTNGKFCDFIEWDSKEVYTKKFTQLPNGQVHEEEAVWPSIGSGLETLKTAPTSDVEPKSAVRDLLVEILAEIKAVRKYQLGEHNE